MNIQANMVKDTLPALLTIENGKKVQSTFSKQEYENRHRKLRQMMADQQVDSVLFSLFNRSIGRWSNSTPTRPLLGISCATARK
jgi:hypothetical protein